MLTPTQINEMVYAIADFWVESLFGSAKSKGNGDNDPLRSALVTVVQNRLTSKVDATEFHHHLCNEFEKAIVSARAERPDDWRIRTGMDYHPSVVLREAMALARVDDFAMPMKALMIIHEHGVSASIGYAVGVVPIWAPFGFCDGSDSAICEYDREALTIACAQSSVPVEVLPSLTREEWWEVPQCQ